MTADREFFCRGEAGLCMVCKGCSSAGMVANEVKVNRNKQQHDKTRAVFVFVTRN